MSDFVAFEPSSLQQLSGTLNDLVSNLEGNLSKIVGVVSATGGHVSGSGSIPRWTAKARDDANDMAARSKEAWALVRQGKAYRPPNFSLVFSPGMVNIDWSATSQSGRQGQQDAKDLNLGKNATRDRLAEVARSVANHRYDKAYLTEFWANADPRVAQQLARILHDQDMKGGGDRNHPLTKSSQRILADFAQGVAAATKLNTLPKEQKAALETALENPPNHDMWSSSMLFKYGPRGTQYDASFLKEMGAKALDWRRTYGGMPTQSEYAVVAPPGAWYTSLGIQGPWLTPSGLGRADGRLARPGDQTIADWRCLAKVVADNDPAAAILGRVGENSAASRSLMQNPSYAKDIISPSWTVPVFSGGGKPIDISGAPGRVAVAATANRTKFPTETAKAALNIFDAVAALRDASQKGNIELRSALPRDMTQALGAMGTQYVLDLAKSTTNVGGSTRLNPAETGVILNKDDLRTYLAVLAKDPTALGIFRGGIDGETSKASMQKLLLGDHAPETVEILGKLNGLASVAEADLHYKDAQLADMAAARKLQLLTMTVGIATGVPISPPEKAKGAVDWLKFLAGQGTGQAGSIVDTGKGAEAIFTNEKNFDQRLAQSELPVAQAIIDLAQLDPENLPSNVQWPKDKKEAEAARNRAREAILEARTAAVNLPFATPDHNRIILRSSDDVSEFHDWFWSLESKLNGSSKDSINGFKSETTADRNKWFSGT